MIPDLRKTFFVKWALVFSYAVALLVILSFEWLIVFVMSINYAFHVEHAAVVYVNVVFIEHLVKFAVWRKVLIN